MLGVTLSILDEMSRVLPDVITMHSGIPELVRDKVSGYLVPERDPFALSHALARLVHDPRLREKMGDAGRGIVERGYDLDELNDRLVDLLAGLSAAHGRPRLVRQTSGVGA
jgi:colanic acid/amylovoran biosynthesis glycosyltransferase